MTIEDSSEPNRDSKQNVSDHPPLATKDLRKKLDFLSKNLDLIDQDSKKFYRNYLTKMVSQNIRDIELKKITDNLKEIDFAEAEAIPGMFEYRFKDEQDRILVSMEVAKEYKEGKNDPNKKWGKKKG